jgi:hypothetical protein
MYLGDVEPIVVRVHRFPPLRQELSFEDVHDRRDKNAVSIARQQKFISSTKATGRRKTDRRIEAIDHLVIDATLTPADPDHSPHSLRAMCPRAARRPSLAAWPPATGSPAPPRLSQNPAHPSVSGEPDRRAQPEHNKPK